jgi:hypothetical protein
MPPEENLNRRSGARATEKNAADFNEAAGGEPDHLAHDDQRG